MEKITPPKSVDIDEQLQDKGCTKQFEKLQLCLADNNRDWSKCQRLVSLWKLCFSGKKKD
eukprot:snap_masked-scaffold_16-processed-gene-2.32-mRNA-1 protein AED:0.42 eAED:0.42 QI:0/-1/0/1/-1/1/1/0/59